MLSRPYLPRISSPLVLLPPLRIPSPKATAVLFLHWLPFAVLSTACVGTAYVLVQQNLRQTANDPQIQMAEDFATALGENRNPGKYFVDTQIVDVSKSLEVFVIVYDDSKRVLFSSALLGSSIPKLPDGVLDATRTMKQNRVTWQPQPGVRLATVVQRYEGPRPGYVVAGRSLREVEQRESNTLVLAAAGLSAAWIGFAVAVAFKKLWI